MPDEKDKKIEFIPIELDVDLRKMIKSKDGVIDPKIRKKAKEIIQNAKNLQKQKKLESIKELYDIFEILFNKLLEEGPISVDRILKMTEIDNAISFNSKFRQFLKYEKEDSHKLKRCKHMKQICYKLIPFK